jgi:hypothetical protein
MTILLARMEMAILEKQVNPRHADRFPCQRVAHTSMSMSETQEADKQVHKQDTSGTYRCTISVFDQVCQRVVPIYRSQRSWQKRVRSTFPSQTMRTTTTLTTLHGYNDTLDPSNG